MKIRIKNKTHEQIVQGFIAKRATLESNGIFVSEISDNVVTFVIKPVSAIQTVLANLGDVEYLE